MKLSPWRVISRRTHTHSPYRKIEDVVFELPDGRHETYSLNKVGRVVCVLALTREGQVVLARQFRPGPGLMLDELPGGSVDEGEDLETAVRRELLEETGYSPGRLLSLGRFLECAYSTIERHGFLALDCEKQRGQTLDPNEFIEVVLKSVDEFVAQIRSGQSTDSEVGWAGLYEAGLVGSGRQSR